MAYYSLEPFGEYRDDLRIGTLAKLLYDLWPGGKDKPAMTVADFMPYLRDGEDEEDETRANHDRMLRMAVALNAMYGGQDLRGQ